MIAIDTNLLVYAHRESSPFHAKALEVVADLAENPALWAIPWPCLHEFLAIVTHPRIFDPPSGLAEAWEFLDALLESPSLQVIGEESGYTATLRSLLFSSQVCGPRIHDARIAAICLNHAVAVLWTADRDFARFPDLRTRNPLIVGHR